MIPTIHVPAVHVGRLRTHPDGGFVIYPDWPSTDTLIQHDDGSGLTATEAERVLDSLDRELSMVKQLKHNPSRSDAENNQREPQPASASQ